MSLKTIAPITLFCYSRPDHLQRNLDSLAKNDLASETEIIAFADGPKPGASEAELKQIEATRDVVRNIKWAKNVTLHAHEKNQGLSNNIINGISQVLETHDRTVVVEDDLVFSKGFLRFMNEALEIYEKDDKVMSVGAYIMPIRQQMPESFFYRGAMIYGWATWKRAWQHFNPSATDLLRQIEGNNEVNRFNINGSFYFYEMLQKDADGRLQSWDVRWHASIFVKNGLSLLPGNSLVNNTGMDGSGQIGSETDIFLNDSLREFVEVKKQEILEYQPFLKAFEEWATAPDKGTLARVKRVIKKVLGIKNK